MEVSELGESQLSPSIVASTSDYSGLNKIDILQLFDPKQCLRCTDLIELSASDARTLQKSWGIPLLSNLPCHYSQGNEQCPAGSIRIVKHSDIDKAVDAYMEALVNGDLARIAMIAEAIDLKDTSTSNLVKSKIQLRMKLLTKVANEPEVESNTAPTSIEPTP